MLMTVSAAQGQEPQAKTDQKADIPATLPKGKKLVLTDGTYQLVRSYEQKGDRVRYWSLERSAWEELPAVLVDWAATRAAETDYARRREESREAIRAIELAERTKDIDVDASLEVAPGVFLPDGVGLYALQNRIVLPLVQVTSNITVDKKRVLTKILIPNPLIPERHKVEIAGPHAVLRLVTQQPEFYIRTADKHEPELELIRAQVRGKSRQIEFLSTLASGEQANERKLVSIERWRLAPGVFRLTLSQTLEPGEYVIAERLPEGLSVYVWDFGVDGAAAPPGSSRPK